MEIFEKQRSVSLRDLVERNAYGLSGGARRHHLKRNGTEPKVERVFRSAVKAVFESTFLSPDKSHMHILAYSQEVLKHVRD